MSTNKLAKTKPAASTQAYLDIAEIKDDLVVMKDGSLRLVLLASSINFALKSEEEQEAIIQSYTNFLNSLDFPLQIVIQSRRLDIEGYLEKTKEIAKEQTNELLRMQTQEYIQYIQELVEMSEIMSKHFYIVVNYNPAGDKKQGFFNQLFSVFSQVRTIKLSRKNFLKYKDEVSKRGDYIAGALQSMGVSAIQIDTQSLIELYYNTYNPLTSANQKMPEKEKLWLEE